MKMDKDSANELLAAVLDGRGSECFTVCGHGAYYINWILVPQSTNV